MLNWSDVTAATDTSSEVDGLARVKCSAKVIKLSNKAEINKFKLRVVGSYLSVVLAGIQRRVTTVVVIFK